ncbi:hypothetical protein VP01_479g1 [Puccinia sorghi]|uniref:Uncharacterized protein n=1 Tax=Puccinia sorghi TaxID=27349 RepID=A0A0L6UMM8_9BASI|nr:hypothetical protein VP01_479g1 [Puccinia sorghi]
MPLSSILQVDSIEKIGERACSTLIIHVYMCFWPNITTCGAHTFWMGAPKGQKVCEKLFQNTYLLNYFTQAFKLFENMTSTGLILFFLVGIRPMQNKFGIGQTTPKINVFNVMGVVLPNTQSFSKVRSLRDHLSAHTALLNSYVMSGPLHSCGLAVSTHGCKIQDYEQRCWSANTCVAVAAHCQFIFFLLSGCLCYSQLQNQWASKLSLKGIQMIFQRVKKMRLKRTKGFTENIFSRNGPQCMHKSSLKPTISLGNRKKKCFKSSHLCQLCKLLSVTLLLWINMAKKVQDITPSEPYTLYKEVLARVDTKRVCLGLEVLIWPCSNYFMRNMGRLKGGSLRDLTNIPGRVKYKEWCLVGEYAEGFRAKEGLLFRF